MSFSNAQKNMASRIDGFERREQKHIEMKERTVQRIDISRQKLRKMKEVRADRVSKISGKSQQDVVIQGLIQTKNTQYYDKRALYRNVL